MSDDLAAYLAYAVDPGFLDYYSEFSRMVPAGAVFKRMISALEVQLHAVLDKHKMTMVQLFRALAITYETQKMHPFYQCQVEFVCRCNEFVFFCELHRKFLITPTLDTSNGTGGFASCCDDNYFSNEPIFHNEGTCFTTSATIVETVPSTTSSLKIWLNGDERRGPSKAF